MDSKILLSINEAAAKLSVSRTTINVLARTGLLKRVKIGKAARIPLHSVESYAASLEACTN